MNKVYSNEELYRQSEKWEPHFCEEKNLLWIDNFYENPDRIYEMLMARPFPLWKYNPESNTRNGIDYNDCRVVDSNPHPSRQYFRDHERLLDICRRYWWKGSYDWNTQYEFNCFGAIKEFDNSMQHYPHIDSELSCPDELATLNMLVYLDKEGDGGTAVYDGEWITNDENYNLIYPVHERFTTQHIIKSVYNRCVVFPGNRMHGAYIDNYSKFTDNWRFTQVTFYHPRER